MDKLEHVKLIEFSHMVMGPAAGGGDVPMFSRNEIVPALCTHSAETPEEVLMAKPGAAALPFAPVNRLHDRLDGPHVQAGGVYDLYLHGQDESVRLTKLPIEADGERPDTATSPPRIGGCADSVLTGWGFDNGQIGPLLENGVAG